MSATLPIVKFCPQCGNRAVQAYIHGRERPQCTACGYVVYHDPKVAAIGFITDGDKVLLGQRKYDPQKGKWGLPGGFVEFGEHPKEAVKRELLEETSLEVAVGDVIDVFHTSGGTTITLAYHVMVISGTPQPADDVVALAWFTRDTLPELAFLSTVKVLERW